jgi:hypothetical protein
MAGNQGPTGITGAFGLQGFRGPKGLPFGVTGPSYRNLNSTIAIQSPTETTITLTEGNVYTFFNIAVQPTTTIVFPITRTETFPIPEQAGMFWVFRNNTSSIITLNFSNATVDCSGNPTASTLDIPKGNGVTIAYASNITRYIAF